MIGRNIIQIQGFVSKPIGMITNEARTIVGNICLGIDEIRLLGNKALVLRAEITPEYLSNLYTDLAFIGIKLIKDNLPDIKALQEEMEYPLFIQIISLSDDTDRRVHIPRVSG